MPNIVLDFEWNADKAAFNFRKHRVSFEEAATAFADELAYIVPDEEHSADEHREILIGYSDRRRLLFVAFIERSPNLIRIISARRANAQEHQSYEEKTRF